MASHRIRYTPRDGWNGAETLKTILLGTVPSLERFTVLPTAERGTVISPGRMYRSLSIDGWIEYEIELRHIPESSVLFRELTAFLAEADAGVTFEFAYDDSKVGDTVLTSLDPFEDDVRFIVADTSAFAVGDRIYVRATWKRSIWGFYIIQVVASPELKTIPEEISFRFLIGDRLTHLGFTPKANLLSHRLAKRRAGQASVDAYDLTLRFREVE